MFFSIAANLFLVLIQAMVHELIGIQDNKVSLKTVSKLPKDQQVESSFLMYPLPCCYPFHNDSFAVDSLCFQEVVLSSEQDTFFKANMYENFGDIGMNIKKMVDDFQQVAKSNQNIQTIGLYLLACSLTCGIQ